MSFEIERKFLVSDKDILAGRHGVTIRQGYMAVTPPGIVRVRIAGDHAFLTLKGAKEGISRPEFEFGIPRAEAEEMLVLLCRKPVIEKTRYPVPHAGNDWVIDVFHCDNEGLVVAEIELGSEEEDVVLPPWAGQEVTHDSRYANASLVDHPYRAWNR